MIPVFALRRDDDHGIGDTRAVREAVEFCARHGFEVLQILPIHDTVGDHSPYNPISSRALSPALLTLDETAAPGLTSGILDEIFPQNWLSQLREGSVKHRLVHSLKLNALVQAYDVFRQSNEAEAHEELKQFEKQEEDWLADYVLFRALAMKYENNPHWEQWQPEHRSPAAARTWLESHDEGGQIQHLCRALNYVQWVARKQWKAVRDHADACGVLLMGEMSFGVSKSSADVWSHRDLFDIEWSMGTRPVVYFDTNKDSETWGQNWGLPPYRWENHRSTHFTWLRKRLQSEAQFFHICRLDHLRGYFRAYMFPWQGGSEHSQFATLSEHEAAQRTGGRLPRFVPAPDDDKLHSGMNDLQGREIIAIMQEAAGPMQLFAEIMGAMPDYMRKALDDLQMPNLTFPLLEKNEDGSINPPDLFRPLSLISYGNHDHAPLASIYNQGLAKMKDEPDSKARTDLNNLLEFAGWEGLPPETLNDELLKALQRSLFNTPCILAVLMIPDLLGIPLRFNLPGSYGDLTWCDRLDFSLSEFEKHPVYGPRIPRAAELARAAGRTSSELSTR